MNRELTQALRGLRCLKNKTVEDIVKSERYFRVLSQYWKQQQEERIAGKLAYQAMEKKGLTAGKHLPAHIIDSLMSMSADDLRDAYLCILDKTSAIIPRERQYISQLCGQAYNYTIILMACDEKPELREKLLPKTN